MGIAVHQREAAQPGKQVTVTGDKGTNGRKQTLHDGDVEEIGVMGLPVGKRHVEAIKEVVGRIG